MAEKSDQKNDHGKMAKTRRRSSKSSRLRNMRRKHRREGTASSEVAYA